MNNEIQKISNWDKPGGKLGMVVAALLGVGAIYGIGTYILQFMVTFAWNAVSIALACAILAAILFLLTDKKFQMMFSIGYFMLMKSITGAFINIDPIAIVERRILDMKKKVEEVSRTMGILQGLIRTNEQKISLRKGELDKAVKRLEYYKEQNDDENVGNQSNEVIRLTEYLQRSTGRLADSKKWLEILTKLEKIGKLAAQDAEREVTFKKEEYEEVRQQHKAFRSVMSIVKGDPDEMAVFNQSMEKITYEINTKLGEMDHVLSSTDSVISQFSADKGASSKQADDLLKKYNEFGVDGMFKSFDDTKAIENKPSTYVGDSLKKVESIKVNEVAPNKKYF